jgi:uncharacterized protein (DUF342 family)
MRRGVNDLTIMKQKEPDQGQNGGQAPQRVFLGDKNDGNLIVTFANNDLEARADFIPPMGKGLPLNPDLVADILDKLNIVYGVRWDAIQETMLECNTGRKTIREILIARGDESSPEVTEYFEMNPLLKEAPRPDGEKARIDFRSFTPFIIVKKDQALARLRPRRPGKEGKNIHGVSLPFPVVRPEGVSGGANTHTDGRMILASINGQLVENNKVLSVQNSLVIKGAVNYGTGNIIFPGDVTIEGPVSDGFKIYSGGSITIKQTFDATDVISKGGLTVSGGIIGRGQPATVKVGGAVRAKFIDNCRVAARKTITVDTEIVNSSVFALENIEMGEKGAILGGEIYSVHGVRTGGIGRKAGKSTRIHCGIDFTVQQEKEKANSRLRILAAKLGKLRELIDGTELGSEKRAKMEELKLRLEEEQKKAASLISDLLGRIVCDNNAGVEVSGDIVPGTLIEICQVALFVNEPLHKVRVRLDKASGKVIAEPL